MDKKELIAKAKEAKSAEELLSLARENNIELTEEQAKECYDRLHSSGELTDDDLEKVAGGVGGDKKWLTIKLRVSGTGGCDH